MILYINACVRDASRTARLARYLLKKLDGPVCEVRPAELAFPTADEDFLKRRDALLRAGRTDDPLFDEAHRFAAADSIVVAAPYWDLSFPAALKQYIEHINVLGITFRYTPEGRPQGLCKAAQLFYVTTAGGAFVPEAFGFGYIKALAQSFYGIADVRLVQAAGLDIDGADAEEILLDVMQTQLAGCN